MPSDQPSVAQRAMSQRPTAGLPPGSRRLLVPIGCVALTLFIATVEQTVAVLGARGDLIAAQARQQNAYDQSVDYRNQLDAIAVDTVTLASQGDPAAKAITDALRQQGIKLPEPKQPQQP